MVIPPPSQAWGNALSLGGDCSCLCQCTGGLCQDIGISGKSWESLKICLVSSLGKMLSKRKGMQGGGNIPSQVWYPTLGGPSFCPAKHLPAGKQLCCPGHPHQAGCSLPCALPGSQGSHMLSWRKCWRWEFGMEVWHECSVAGMFHEKQCGRELLWINVV